ncbi:hypothetical protein [Phenylobacterium sp.]|uniref:hypothetical protein n=1 Tax=Phenylobacterium sp. TaxID=1871053 RepID=UPI00301C60AC
MNPLLPRLQGQGYDGRAARIFLGLMALLTLVPGLIHSYLPDGGAGVIAGLEMGARRESVVGLFAWKGATQIPFGIVLLVVALRYPALTPLFLLMLLMERGMLIARWWVYAPPSSGHHPPEHYTSLVVFPLTALFLALSLRRKA